MSSVPVCDIRAALCTVEDPVVFLHTIRAVAASCDTRIICFNADMMAGKSHAMAAVRLAVRASEEGSMVSNSLEMESLLFAAGSRQCSIASSFGIRAGENRVYICCYPSKKTVWAMLENLFCFTRDSWNIIDPKKTEHLQALFGISDDEISAAGGYGRLKDLVLERVALLQVLK